MTLQELESHPMFRRAYWLRNVYMTLTLAAEVLFLWFLACIRIDHVETDKLGSFEILGFWISFDVFSWGTFWRIALLLVLQIGFAHWGLVRMLRRRKEMIQLHPRDHSHGEVFGELTGPQVRDVVLEQARLLGVGKIAFIGIARQPDPNAYTARLLGLGNVVILHRNLLEVLPPEAVRSVIAHEIGHIRRKDSLVYQLLGIPVTFAWVVALLVFMKIGAGILDSTGFLEFIGRVWFFALAFSLTITAFSYLGKLRNLASQQTELMVDSYAALNCGWDTHLNALLLIGQRAEALKAFLEALGKVAGRIDDVLTETDVSRMLAQLPPRVLAEGVAKEAAAGLYIRHRLEQLRRKLLVPLTDQQIGDFASRGAEALRTRNLKTNGALPKPQQPKDDPRNQPTEQEKKEAEEKERLLDWQAFDSDDSGRLDPPELAKLVADLKANPTRMIFRTFLEPEAQWQSHPTIRHRILYLYDLFALP